MKKHLLSPTAWPAVLACWLLLALSGSAALAQTITSFAPTSGVAGTSVTITGTGFNGVTNVRFNGVLAASFAAANSTTITAVVPTGATSGPVTVSTGGGTGTSTAGFVVNQPSAGRIRQDGYREALYGAAVAVQTAATGFGNATNGSQTTALLGSELDAAYTRVSGDTLFVLLTGNLEDNGNVVDIFFDSQTGGRNVLTNLTAGTTYNNMVGLRFDAAFAADYYLTISDQGSVLGAQFANLVTGTVQPSGFGSGRSVIVATGNGLGIVAGIDNSNTGGVNDATVGIGWPAAVVSGVEFAIPLSALGSPTGSLKIAAFINNADHSYLSNQVLGPLPTGTPNLANSAMVDFTTYAGNQYFTVNIPAAGLAPTIASFSPGSGAAGTIVSISGTNLTGATAVSFNGTAAIGYTVNAAGTVLTAAVPAGATTGTISVTTPNGTATSGTSFTVPGTAQTVTSLAPASGVAGTLVTITGTGLGSTTAVSFGGVAATFTVVSSTSVTAVVPAGASTGVVTVSGGGSTTNSAAAFVVDQPRAGRILFDGYREARYGTALALQTTATGFGNATNGDPTTALMGSELDAAYARVSGDSLYVFVAGNLENNGNALDVFFDSQTGGQNTLTTANPIVDNNALGALAGLQFDNGFAADYYLTIKTNGAGTTPLVASFATLGAGGANVNTAVTGTGRSVALTLGSGRTGALALDNANTGGVTDAAVPAGGPAGVVRGLEFVLPLAALGSPTGSLRVAAFINNATHDYLSNQVLASLPAGTTNLAQASLVSFASAANGGNQYFTVNIPAANLPTLTAIAPSTGSVGGTISLTGTNLTGATAITFTGTSGNVVTTGFTVNAGGTQITGVVVPTGATTGNVTVTTPNGTSAGVVFTLGVPQLAVFQGAGLYVSNGPTFSFGAQNVGTTSAPVTFTLTNNGNGALAITSISATGDFALSGTVPTTVTAGTSGTVAVTFAPTNGGVRTGSLVIVSSLGTYTVNLSGNGFLGAPTLTGITPSTGAVGSTIALTGTNLTGATTITFSGVGGNIVTTGFTVTAGGTGITGVVVPAGATSGPVTVTTSVGTSTGVTFTLAAPQLNVVVGTTPYPSGGAAFAFPNTPVGTMSSAEAFDLNNAGNAPLTLTSVTISGDFVIVGPAPTTAAAGGRAQVAVAFTPTAVGVRTGVLTIVSSLGTYTVNLTGNGVLPAPTISAVSPTGGAVGSTVTVTGTGFTATGTTVTLNGVAVTPVTVGAGGTTLTFTVPIGATAGPVVVTTANGSSSANATFCVQYTPTLATGSTCGTGTVTLGATGAPAGSTYALYSAATGGTALNTSTTGSFTTPSISATTTYYVGITTGSAPSSCEGPRAAVIATVNAAPTAAVAASGPVTFCQGGSVTLTASGGGTYLWSSGQSTPSITVSTAGSYTVTVTSTAGCAATSAATVVAVNPLPTAPTLTQTTPGVLTSSAATGNQFYLNGAIVPGATGQSYTVPGAAANGSYTVVTTSAAGCASSPSAAVAVLLAGTANATAAGALQVYPNPAHGTATVLVPALTAPAALTLTNALGQVVQRRTLAPTAGSRLGLDVQALPAGVYLLRLTTAGASLRQRLVVE